MGIESRPCWLAAVALQHLADLKDRLIDQDYAGTTDAELNYQHDFWAGIIENINRELASSIGGTIADYPNVRKGRAVGRITWRL